jgi:glycosyltransferase involved in cell wall biosynthesis
MDVCAFPSHREGLGLVLLEAAAMEVPAVATEIPGCVDAVQKDITALLVPPRDAAALAEAIATYLRSPQLRRQHGEAGRARVLRDFCPETVRQAVCEQYLSLLRRKGLPLPVSRATLQPVIQGRRAA